MKASEIKAITENAKADIEKNNKLNSEHILKEIHKKILESAKLGKSQINYDLRGHVLLGYNPKWIVAELERDGYSAQVLQERQPNGGASIKVSW